MKEAIGWALFHFLWEGAAIALVLAIALALCNSARSRYAAACTALLVMLAAFGATFAWKMPKTVTNAAAVHVPAGPLAPRPTATIDDAVGNAAAAMPYEWAVPIWVAGVAVFSLRRLMGLAGAYRLRHTGVRLAPAPWPARMAELAARLGIRRTVQLMESCLTEVPVMTGYLRPVVLLPVGMLAGLPTEQVEYILIHELAHVARRDYLVSLLQGVVEALLFYHPAVWWVSTTIRAEREHCCDDAVVSLAGDARGYAAALVNLEQARVLEPALAATGGSLTRRVRRLLRQPVPQSMAAPLSAMGLALVLMGVALAANDPQQVPPPSVALPHPGALVVMAQAPVPQRPVMKKDPSSEPPEVTTEPQTPYRQWLTQDVAYIITNEERSAYKALQTDAEREQFITDFWLRRDPTPGTAQNEFKDEHYRRINYVNEHFSSKTLAGWKTDRGRIYISYGPPDEIEDHPAGGNYQANGTTSTVYPFQQWRYRMIEGVGQDVIVEFVDPNMTGEFRMTKDPAEKIASPDALNEFQRIENFRQAAQRPKAQATAPGAAAGNVFVANEPGGRATVTVDSEGRVTFALGFKRPGPWGVSMQTTRADGKEGSGFGSGTSAIRTDYTHTERLSPGAYVLTLTYRNSDTGEQYTETVNFYVN
jgi:GWxTD domain-containing protein